MLRRVLVCALGLAFLFVSLPSASASPQKSTYRLTLRDISGATTTVPDAERSLKDRAGDKMRATLAEQHKPEKATTEYGPQAYDPYTKEECRAEFPVRSGERKKHHFAYCAISYGAIDSYECKPAGCAKIGTRYLRFTLLGQNSRTSEVSTYWMTIDQWSSEGRNVGGRLKLQLLCYDYVSGTRGPCQQTEDEYWVEDTIDGWMTTRNDVSYTGSFDTSAYGPDPIGDHDARDNLHYHDMYIQATVTDNRGVGLRYWWAGEGFRCDHAPYVNSACIYDQMGAWFRISRARNPESADHIDDALTSPGVATKPEAIGVTIPGGEGTTPLTRNWWDTSLVNRNREKSRQACLDWYPGQWPAPNTDCDEYPFARTYQGSASVDQGPLWYSVRPILDTDNRSVGGQLGQWYTNDHILDRDPFWVGIDP